jgi:hypothetical protein
MEFILLKKKIAYSKGLDYNYIKEALNSWNYTSKMKNEIDHFIKKNFGD